MRLKERINEVHSQVSWTQLPCLPLLTPHSHPALLFIVNPEKTETLRTALKGIAHPFTPQTRDLTLLPCHFQRSYGALSQSQVCRCLAFHPAPFLGFMFMKRELNYLGSVGDAYLQCLNAKGAKDKMMTPGNFVYWPVSMVNIVSLRVIILGKCCWEKMSSLTEI